MKITEYIGTQFANPRGVIGKVCCIIMNTMNKAMYRSLIVVLNNKRNRTILDIGFGNGYLIHRLAQNKGNEIYGIDTSRDMLVLASKRNERAIQEQRVKLSIGDCCCLKFADQSFDIVTAVNTIYFWPDALQGLCEISRVLKKEGVCYNVVYSKKWLKKFSYTQYSFRFFEKEDYLKLGKEAGFSKVEIDEIASGKSYRIRYIK